MRLLLTITLILLTSVLKGQDTIPVQDTTTWLDFRDNSYNPNMLVTLQKFDSIYDSFVFRLDSILVQKLLVVDSIKFSSEDIIYKRTYNIQNVVFDTVRFNDGSKQTTAFTP
jgi:hypothetical protein